MELVKPDHPSLLTPCEEFDFSNPPFDPIEFAKEMVKLMRDNSGIGLAANQLGQPYRIFSLRTDPNKVLFNPRIVLQSSNIDLQEESCLTYPGFFIKIPRSLSLKIRYQQPNSETMTETYFGLTARCIQHEMMHLDGLVFFDGLVSKMKIEMAIKKAKKYGFDYSKLGLIKYGT